MTRYLPATTMRRLNNIFRARLVATLIAGITLALASYWLMEVARKNIRDDTSTNKKTEPDFYIDGIRLLRLTPSGNIQYKVAGKQLTHIPANDSYEIDHPLITSLQANQAPTITTALKARITDNNSKIHLFENVSLNRAPLGRSAYLHFESNYLLILPNEDILQTNLPMTLTMGNLKLTGNNMLLNNFSRQVTISGKTQSHFNPAVK